MPDRIIAIVHNGRAAGGGARDLRQRIEAMLGGPDRRLMWCQPRSAARLDATCAAAADQADLLVAVGGDGTVHTVAQAARAAGKPMAIIPTGTYNYVARHLGIPLALDAACRLAIEGTARPTPGGELGGRLFFNHAAFGLYTRIIAARERHTALLGRSRVTALLSGLATLFNRYPKLRLRLSIDGATRECRAAAVFFGANPLQLASVDPAFAERCRNHALGLLIVQHQRRRRLLLAALNALVGRLSRAPEFELIALQRARVDVLRRRRRLRVSIDGEIIKCPLPLEIRYVPDAVHVVRPDTP